MSFITQLLMQGTFGSPGWGNISDMSWSGSTTAPVSDYYDILSADIGGQIPSAFYLRSDGTMFFTGDTNEYVRRWDMSTPFDLTTASYYGSVGGIAGYDNSLAGVFFEPDGTNLFMIGNQNNKIYRRPMTTPWTSQNNNTPESDSVTSLAKSGLFFRADGLRFYFTTTSIINTNTTSNRVYQYDCGGAWSVNSVSSAGSMSQTFTHSNGQYEPFKSVDFSPDGTKMYVVREVSSANNVMMQYPLASAWNVTTAGTATSVTLPTDLASATNMRMKQDGTAAFLLDRVNNGSGYGNVFRIGYS